MKLNDDDRVSEMEIPCPEQDGPTEYVEKLMNGVSALSAGIDNSSLVQKISCRINNIYVIGGINASSVRLGDSAYGKDITTTEKHTPSTTTCKPPACNYSQFKHSKTCLLKYFDKTKSSTQWSTMMSPTSAVVQELDNKVEDTDCHCQSRDKQNFDV